MTDRYYITDMMTVTCKIPDRLDAELEALARKLGVSKSEVMRASFERTVENGLKASKLSAYDLMKDCCGIVKGGPSDYATNPKYLEDFGK